MGQATPDGSTHAEHIDFWWPTSQNGNDAEWHAIRYTGTLYIEMPTEYTFYLWVDDGAQLWIGSHMLIDRSGCGGQAEPQAQMQLEAGPHTIEVYYYNCGGHERIRLSYEAEGMSKRVIPPSAFIPPTIDSLTARYFNMTGLSHSILPDLSNLPAVATRRESNIIYPRSIGWGGPALTQGNHWAVQWTGQIFLPFYTSYNFYVESEGSARVWIDDILVIDDGQVHTNREMGSGDFRLQRGLHTLRVDYMLNAGAGDHGCTLRYRGHARVDAAGTSWDDTGIMKQIIPQSVYYGGEYSPFLFTPSFDVCTETPLECGGVPADCAVLNATYSGADVCVDGVCCEEGQTHIRCSQCASQNAQSDHLLLAPLREGCISSPLSMVGLTAASISDASMSVELCNILCLGHPYFLLLLGADCYCAPADAQSLVSVDDALCNAICSGDSSEQCGGATSDYAVLYDRVTLRDNQTSAHCNTFYPDTCGADDAEKQQLCEDLDGLLLSTACTASNGAPCRSCDIVDVTSTPLPPATPQAPPASSPPEYDPMMPRGTVQAPECGGESAYTCYRDGTNEPSTGCLVPWDHCTSGIAEAVSVSCASGMSSSAGAYATCDDNCTLTDWEYICSETETSDRWKSSNDSLLRLEHAIWSMYIEVSDFSAGDFIRRVAEAAVTGLQAMRDTLSGGSEALTRAQSRVTTLRGELANARASACGADINAHCDSSCTARLFGWCVHNIWSTLQCHVVCRAKQLLLLAAELGLLAAEAVLWLAARALDGLGMALAAAQWGVQQIANAEWLSQLFVMHHASISTALVPGVFNKSIVINLNGSILGAKFVVTNYYFSLSDITGAITDLVKSIVYPGVECSYEDQHGSTTTDACTDGGQRRRRRLVTHWNVDEAARTLAQARRALAAAKAARQRQQLYATAARAEDTLHGNGTYALDEVSPLEVLVETSLREDADILAMLSQLPVPHPRLRFASRKR